MGQVGPGIRVRYSREDGAGRAGKMGQVGPGRWGR